MNGIRFIGYTILIAMSVLLLVQENAIAFGQMMGLGILIVDEFVNKERF